MASYLMRTLVGEVAPCLVVALRRHHLRRFHHHTHLRSHRDNLEPVVVQELALSRQLDSVTQQEGAPFIAVVTVFLVTRVDQLHTQEHVASIAPIAPLFRLRCARVLTWETARVVPESTVKTLCTQGRAVIILTIVRLCHTRLALALTTVMGHRVLGLIVGMFIVQVPVFLVVNVTRLMFLTIIVPVVVQIQIQALFLPVVTTLQVVITTAVVATLTHHLGTSVDVKLCK